MKAFKNLEINEEYLECKVDLPLAILRIKENAFKNIASIEKNAKTFEWLNNVGDTKEIKTILVVADKFALSDKSYHGFLSEVFGKRDFIPNETSSMIDTRERAVEINSLSYYARKFIKLNKLIICGLNGEVATPFFGLSLLADLRFGSENMVFSLSHLKYGIHPSGLLPIMLPKYIGLGKAMKYLITGGKINANEAFDLGLLSKVLSNANFEKQCIEEAKRISLNSQNVIQSTKDLFYNFNKELEDYIHKETTRYTYY